MAELSEETEENSQYIRDEGYDLVQIWECQWRHMKKTNSPIKEFLASEFQRPLDKHRTLTEQQIVQAVRDGSLSGCVECDIRVPDSLKSKFSEMCRLFLPVQFKECWNASRCGQQECTRFN